MKLRTIAMPHLPARRAELADPPEAVFGPLPEPVAVAPERADRLRALVDAHVAFVARVLRNAGTPPAEIDDDVQRTFIAAARRLEDIRPGAEKAFLLRTALNVAAHARRTLARRREVRVEDTPERVEPRPTPEELTDRKRMRELLDRVLAQMDASLREVFVLYELEELDMGEIATAVGIPRGTVASRLRRARADFRARVRAIEALAGAGEER